MGVVLLRKTTGYEYDASDIKKPMGGEKPKDCHEGAQMTSFERLRENTRSLSNITKTKQPLGK
jgi:hypothetical protein